MIMAGAREARKGTHDGHENDWGRRRERDEGRSSLSFRGADLVVSSGIEGGKADDKGKEKEDGGERGRKQPIPASFKEKLLSLSGSGFLMKHEEEDDIVQGWKSCFSKKNLATDKEKNMDELDGEGHEGVDGKIKIPTLHVIAKEYANWCKPWTNLLIIKLLGAHISKRSLEIRINRMWKPQEALKTRPLNHGYHIVSFMNKEDRDYAFQEGPWMIDDHYLLVQRWRPNFNPWKADTQKRIAIWIKIPDLPVEFYNVYSLWRIGNMVGKIDLSTFIYDKGGFARICVEVDLQQLLVPAFTDFGEDRMIVYEDLHMICFHCGKYGHQAKDCSMRLEMNLAHSQSPAPSESEQTQHTTVQSKRQASGSTTAAGRVAVVEEKSRVTEFGPGNMVQRDFRRQLTQTDMKGHEKGIRAKSQQGMRSSGDMNQGSRDTMNKKFNEDKSKDLRPRAFGKELNQNPSVWVPVGSKRKGDARLKSHGKENRSVGGMSTKRDKVVGPSHRPIENYNSFAFYKMTKWIGYSWIV